MTRTRRGRARSRLFRQEELDVPAGLASEHLDRLPVGQELAEIAEEEPPAAASLVEVLLPDERQRFIAADSGELV